MAARVTTAGRSAVANRFDPSWLPATLPSVRLWLRGDSLAAAAVASWADRRGTGTAATQGTGSQQPTGTTNRIGGQTAAVFNSANNQGLVLSSFVVTQPCWMAIVTDSGPAGSGWYIDGIDAGARAGIVWDSATTLSTYGGSAFVGATATKVAQYTVVNLNGASSVLYRNGKTFASGNPGTQGVNGFTFGNRFAFDSPIDGGIGEIIIGDGGVLSSTDLGRLFGYFRDRYSIVQP